PGKSHIELGRDVCVETTACHRDRKGVLMLLPAGVDALVTEAASAVVTDVELLLDLCRLGHRGRPVDQRFAVVTRMGSLPWRLSLPHPEPGRVGAVTGHPVADLVVGPVQFAGAAEQLHHQTTAVLGSLGAGV